MLDRGQLRELVELRVVEEQRRAAAALAALDLADQDLVVAGLDDAIEPAHEQRDPLARIGVPCSSTSWETAVKRGASRPTNDVHGLDLVRAEHVDREAPRLLRGLAGARAVGLQTRTSGGSSETLVNEFAAMPQWTSPAPAVTIVTPVGYAAITERKTPWSIIACMSYASRAARRRRVGERGEERRLERPRWARAAPPDRDDLPAHRGRADDRRGAEHAVGELARDRGVGEQRDAEPAAHHLLGGVDVVELHHAARYDAGRTEERAGQLVVARAAVEEHELLAAELLDAHLAVDRERMVGRA